MRIALISTFGVKCGIATYTEHLAQKLFEEHEVTVFAEDCLKNERPDFKSDVNFVRCFNRKTQDNRLLNALESYQPDIVHIQHEYGIFKNLRDTLVKLHTQHKGKTIITLHTVKTKSKFDLYDCADFFIVHNEHARRYLIEQCGILPDKVKVIPHGTLIIPRISPELSRSRFNLPLDHKIILSHAFFERRKNIHKIIKVVAELKNEFPLYYLHIGGLHPHVSAKNGLLYFNECLQLIKKLGVISNVRFINGFVPEDEMKYLLNASDIIVTLESSNFPNISASGVMHTVACKPVIASNVINFAEFPEGTLYRVKIEENSLKQAIRNVLLNPKLSYSLSNNLLEYAKKTSWSTVAKEHVKLYEKCLVSEIEYIYSKKIYYRTLEGS